MNSNFFQFSLFCHKFVSLGETDICGPVLNCSLKLRRDEIVYLEKWPKRQPCTIGEESQVKRLRYRMSLASKPGQDVVAKLDDYRTQVRSLSAPVHKSLTNSLRETPFWNVLFPFMDIAQIALDPFCQTGTTEHFFRTQFLSFVSWHRQNELEKAQTILTSVLTPQPPSWLFLTNSETLIVILRV